MACACICMVQERLFLQRQNHKLAPSFFWWVYCFASLSQVSSAIISFFYEYNNSNFPPLSAMGSFSLLISLFLWFDLVLCVTGPSKFWFAQSRFCLILSCVWLRRIREEEKERESADNFLYVSQIGPSLSSTSRAHHLFLQCSWKLVICMIYSIVV